MTKRGKPIKVKPGMTTQTRQCDDCHIQLHVLIDNEWRCASCGQVNAYNEVE